MSSLQKFAYLKGVIMEYGRFTQSPVGNSNHNISNSNVVNNGIDMTKQQQQQLQQQQQATAPEYTYSDSAGIITDIFNKAFIEKNVISDVAPSGHRNGTGSTATKASHQSHSSKRVRQSASTTDSSGLVPQQPHDTPRQQSEPNGNTTATSSSSKKHKDLRIKIEYRSHNRCIMMPRPVSFRALKAKISEMFDEKLAVYYTAPHAEILVPITDQSDLDDAVRVVERSHHMHSLRLFLSRHHEPKQSNKHTSNEQCNDPSNSTNGGRSFSPPPGQRHRRTHSTHRHNRKVSSNRSGSVRTQDLVKQIAEVPYKSSASSIASSRISVDYTRHPQRLGHGGGVQQSSSKAQLSSSNASHHSTGGHHRHRNVASRASSSSSSGLVADFDHSKTSGTQQGPISGGRVSATSPRAPENWRSGRSLGSGSFGQVFLCYDADTGKELAVKRVLTGENLKKEVAALENEIGLLSSCQHERIVTYCGTQKDAHSLCIFMEYMPGGSLKDELRHYGPLTETVARKYTRQIFEGLQYLHNYEIVHRDIKSANILRDGHGNVKIGDFGSGKRLQKICAESAAQTFVGTISYMAPEVVRGSRYGRKADIWGVACTLVEMLTGRTPWAQVLGESDHPAAVLFKIACEQPSYILPEECTHEMGELLAWLFCQDPRQRPYAHELLHPLHLALIDMKHR